MSARTLYSGDTFEHKGRTFRVTFEHDDSHGAPWEECDGHGIVSDWTTRAKNPGERVLAEDGRSRRFYDFAASVQLARRDGWGTSATAAPYSAGTKGERAARAVEEDYEFLRLWCADQWEYVGVIVTLLDASGEPTRYQDSLWGVESYKDYHCDVARECADNVLGDYRASITRKAKETRERNYWAARDVVTI